MALPESGGRWRRYNGSRNRPASLFWGERFLIFVVENNALGDKDKLPVNIFDINPLKPNVLDADGDPHKGGGGKGILPLGRGSTWRTTPNSLGEKLSMEQEMSNPSAGRQLPVPMTDTGWPRSEGWVKKWLKI